MRTIEIDNIPDLLYGRLDNTATAAGLSIADYVRRQLEGIASRPTSGEIRERLNGKSRIALLETPADAVRAERGPLR